MAKNKTNWQEVAELVKRLVEQMVETAVPLSYLRSQVDSTSLPTITKNKLLKYFKEAITAGAFYESPEELGKYLVNNVGDNYFKPKSIVNFCKFGKIAESIPQKPKPEKVIEISTVESEFALRQEVYFVQDNKFEKGYIAGIMFIDTDKLEGLTYLVKFTNKEGNSTTKQMFPEEVFASIADLGNSLIRNFKERNPDYGHIKR